MIEKIYKHIIFKNEPVRAALIKLDLLASDAILFVIDENEKLLGSLTDGDLRRGFIKGLNLEQSLLKFIQPKPIFIRQNEYTLDEIENYKKRNFKIIPIVNIEHKIIDILNFRTTVGLIPVDALIMAGGEGKRLRPLTETIPKPLLKVGDKPIIEHNIDRLINCGVKKISLSINYLGDQLEQYFGDGADKGINIQYVREHKPLGTIGSILLVDDFSHDDIIIMNSDLLTNIDFLDFFKTYQQSKADMIVATTSYHVDVPYGVLETGVDMDVKSLKEKPRYTYYSNAGIYILKRNLLNMIPNDTFYDVTDLMERIIQLNLKLVAYPINGYWLDIGKHEDFKKAQEDIKHIKF
ncbi:nucleotidyltransferase family protein [Pedobacter helvus]|uniref:Nucleotidyltransferase family protein n=1 Tax=Pedobacter helvus TaxID=2563444 RepID=A0ABW9JF16_9SPHI|nr:nucleotidyltransferase family protein [Pedobacter ureilyticus]